MYTEREKAQQVNAERYPNLLPRFPRHKETPKTPTTSEEKA